MEQYLMYLRKSRQDRDFTDEPVMHTLQRHKQRLDEYCRYHDIIVPEENILYEVAGADSIASRPKMMELLGLVETGRYEAVLCIDMDRLSRGSGADQALVINTFKYSNTKIITPGKTYDFANDMDEQFAELNLFIAKGEYRQIKKRLRQGKVDATKEGKYAASNPPYGYETYKLKGQKGYSLKIVPEEAEVVRLIYQKYIDDNIGAHSIAKYLNENGIRTRQGNVWLAAHVSKILRDPTYIGKIRFAHRVKTKVMRNGETITVERNNDENQIVCDGLHDPIISEETFERAAEVRQTHFIPHTRRSFETQNPFCGLLVCSECGKTLALRSADKTGRAVFCPTPGCPTKASYVQHIEEEVLDWMNGWLENYEMNPKVKDCTEDIKNKEKDLEKTKQRLTAEINKQKRIYTLLEDGIYSTEEYKQRMLESKSRISDLEGRVLKEQSEIDHLKDYNRQVITLAPRIESVVERYRSLPTAKEKNILLKHIFEKIVYTKTDGGNGKGRNFELEVFPLIPKDPDREIPQ